MELELGLKITKTRDDLTSTTNFRLAKDPSGPIFMSRETESKFILTAHLKGFGREHIGIKINEDGTQIAISGERPVQDMVMSGWMMHKKDVELRGFIRVFWIPDGIVLDRINAKFNEQDLVLTILMPKSVNGIRGVGIEEVKEEKVDDKERKEPKKVGKLEESVQMLRKKADKGRSKKETSTQNAKQKEIVGGKIKEPNIETKHETDRALGESSKKGDSTIEASKKVEEPTIAKKEESDLFDKPKVDEERLNRTKLVTDRLSQKEECHQKHDVKSSEQTEQQKEKAIKAQKEEVDQATKQTFEEVATLDRKELHPEKNEFLEVKHQKIPEEKTKAFGEPEISDTKDGIEKVEDKVYAESETIANSSRTLDRSDFEDGIKKVEDEVFEDLELIEKSTKLEPDHLAEEHHVVEEARDREESLKKEDEVEEEAPKKEKEENEDESPLVEVKKDRSGEVSQGKKKTSSRKIKLCTPCVIAGSSIILSVVVFAIHWIRSKKKETR